MAPSVRPGSTAPRANAALDTTFTEAATPASESEPRSGSAWRELTVVGLGASAGGLEALEAFLDAVPDPCGLAFVIVTHQHPEHTSLLPVLLARHTRMQVIAAEDGAVLQADRVYVSPPGKNLTLEGQRLRTTDIDGSQHLRSPIDGFFRSLAEEQGERAVCVVLSGNGTDGTLGLRAIKGNAGMAMVQDEHSARYSGMPQSAAATQLADYVLPPGQMPAALITYARGPRSVERSVGESDLPGVLPKIVGLLRNRTGHDFSGYKLSTIHRRVERRMKVHQIDQPPEYMQLLQANEHELDLLFRELLITVTSFFRDPEAFVALKGALIEVLQERPKDPSLRVWVPGCSTGEEAYSIAMLSAELAEELGRALDVQIFATDLDVHALEVARAGSYPEGVVQDVTAARLSRFFKHEGDGYRIKQEIRARVVFAVQNVLRDPPFTKLDLLTCRNLLIYLNSELQKRIFPLFNYALNPGGILLLGTSETAAGHEDLFDSIDRKWKLYRNKRSEARPKAAFSLPSNLVAAERSASGPRQRGVSTVSLALERVLLDRFAPPSVIVSDQGDIAYIHGRTGEYLEPSSGEPRSNLFAMAREGLRLSLASALRRASTEGREVTQEGIRVRTNGKFHHVNVIVGRLSDPESVRGLYRVSFEPTAQHSADTPNKKSRALVPEGEMNLEQELAHMKDSLQGTIDALQTSNEELKSTNEELQSTNEELQSSNEELESSKEELQSLNEEFQTVNAELQTNVDQLARVSDDMQNLLNSTEIATLFLDRELRIKRFTTQAQKLIRLIANDIDRPVFDLVMDLEYDALADDARRVLETLVPHEVEVRTRTGHWVLARILPYLTAKNEMEGVVLTFLDIDRVKRAEGLAQDRAFADSIVQTVREPLLVLDSTLKVVLANRAFTNIFQLGEHSPEDQSVFALGGGVLSVPRLRELLDQVIARNRAFEDFEIHDEFPGLGRRRMLVNARRLQAPGEYTGKVLLALEDITNRPH